MLKVIRTIREKMNISVMIVQMARNMILIREFNLATRDRSTTIAVMIADIKFGSPNSLGKEYLFNALIVHTTSIMQHAKSIKILSVNSVRRILLWLRYSF